MAFKLGDLLVDRITMGLAQSTDGTQLYYTLKNLQDATIDITADSTDAVDGTGAVIKTFYRGKTGTLTATNSTLSLPILGAMSGSDPSYASENNILKDIPKIIETANTKDIKLPGITDDGTSEKILVYAISNNGTLGQKYEVGTAGDDQAKGTYAVTTGTDAKTAPSTLTIVPKDGDEKFVIEYKRNVSENAVKITNRSDKFPKSVRLTLKVLIVDPCETDVVRAAYVVIPSFQPSAEVSFGMTTDATLDFTGNLQTSYCAKEKILYEVIAVQDDVEKDE